MCRSLLQGGRKCPCRQSPEYKKRALERRKKNRAAKSNLKKYLKEQGMEDTAKKLSGINPSQIPSFMEKLGLDPKVLGVKAPAAVVGVKEGNVEADEFVATAAKEAKEKGLKLSMFIKDSVDTPAISTPEIPADKQEAKFDRFLKFEGYSSDEYSKAVAAAIVGEYAKNENIDVLYDFIADVNVEKVGGWKALKDYFMTADYDVPSEEEQRLISRLDKVRAEIEQENEPTMTADPFTDEGVKKVTETNDSSEKWKEWNEKITHACHSFYGDTGRFVKWLVYAQKEQKELTTIPLGGGLYATKIGLLEERVFVFRGGNEHETGIRAFDPVAKSAVELSPEAFNSMLDREGNFILGKKLGDEGLRQVMSEGIMTEERLRGGTYYIQKGKEARATRMQDNIANSMVNLSNTYAIAHGKTFLHKKFSENYQLIGDNAAQRESIFNKGTAFIAESNPELAESAKKSETFRELKSAIESADHVKNCPYTENKELDAERKYALDTLKHYEQAAIWDYTGSSYRSFGELATGGEDGYQKYDYQGVTFEDVENANSGIKRIQEKNARPRLLYRGYNPPKGMNYKQYAEALSPGSTFVTSRITSTTVKPNVTAKFMKGKYSERGNVVMVYLPTKKGIALGKGTSKFADEEGEVLVGIGEKFTVVDTVVDEKKNTAFVYVADENYRGQGI